MRFPVVLLLLVLASAAVPAVSADREYRYWNGINLSAPNSPTWSSTWPVHPLGIALSEPPGNVYVSDVASNTVTTWKIETGERVNSIGSRGTGVGEFVSPGDLVTDPRNGRLFIVDQGNLRIHIYDPFANADQIYLGYGTHELSAVTGVAFTVLGDPPTTYLYVTDAWGNKCIRYINGTLDSGFRLNQPPEAALNGPMDVAVGRDNTLYVLNSGRGTVQAYDPGGNLISSWGGFGNGTGQLNWPYSMTVDTRGDLFVSDTHNNRIQKYSPNGTLLATFGEKGSGSGQIRNAAGVAFNASGDGELSTPAGIAVDATGIVYVVDSDNSRIVMFKELDADDPVPVPGGVGVSRDLDGDGTYEDVNGNGRKDFADVTLYFTRMAWIAGNEPLAPFDFNGNGRIDFADVVLLFDSL
jgi:PKD repeat protein